MSPDDDRDGGTDKLKSFWKTVTEKIRGRRGGVFCALMFLTSFWAAWPVAQMGFVDDWSYIKTAEVLARTGRLVYNGWSVELLGWMAAWGALFIRIFGFSFMAVKLSTLPLAVGCVLLFYAILIRFEIGPRNAVIGTLTLGLSPLFLPLSASFMTDVPGLFVILLCLYCCQRALAARAEWAAMAWLAAGAASSVVGGTARQPSWLGVLVMVPCAGWLLRKRRGVFAAAMVLWLGGIGGVLYCLQWFGAQPYSIQMPVLPKAPTSAAMGTLGAAYTGNLMGAEVLVLLVMVFPVLVAWLPRFGKRADHWIALLCFGALPMMMGELIFRRYAEIWPPSVLFEELATRKDASIAFTHDMRRSLIPVWGQIVISLVVIAAALGCVFAARKKGGRELSLGQEGTARAIVWLLVPYSLSYFALLLTLGWQWIAFDRYVLGVMPCAIVASIWLYQRCIGPKLPASTVAMVALFGVIGIAGTHDWFAWQRARLRAIDEVRAAGVPRTEIQGGFEYDGWTQVRDGGHMNDPRIRIPAGAYEAVQKTAPMPGVPKECAVDYALLPELTALHPKYSVAVGPRRCYLPSKFPEVHYRAWLPPFERTIEVQRVPKGSE